MDIQGARRRRVMRDSACDNTLYSFGTAIPARSRCTTSPARCTDLRARRRAHRPVGGRPGAHPPPRRAALQRLPRRAAQAAHHALGGACRQPGGRAPAQEIYRDIDEVDTVVGLFAEPPPTGFGFSDTAFRIFILMASRRLQSDRFLTVDFRPGDLLAVRHGLDRQQRHDQPDPAALPGARRHAAAHGERLRALAADHSRWPTGSDHG